MNLEQLILHIEALIFASQQAITFTEIKEYISNIIEEPLEDELIQQGIETIQQKYASAHYPFEIKMTGGGYQFLTKPNFHQTISQLNGDKFIKKLSNTAMETLSIIAYKQPVTKSEIEYIRGVSADYSIQKLLEKELIVIAGRNEDAIGKPLVYTTSKNFMDYLGINAADELPKIKEIYNMEIVVPTESKEAIPIKEKALIVDNAGQLKIF